MAIGILGTPTAQNNNTSYTAVAGSSRVVLNPSWSRRTGAVSQTQTVWNSVTRTPAITGNDFGGDDRSGVSVCIFKEAEIGGASNLVMTWSATPASQGQLPITVEDVDQVTTVRAGAPAGFGGTAAVDLAIPNVSVGDLLIAVAVNRNGATYVVNNSWTQLATGTNGDGGRWIYVYKIAVGSDDDLSLTQNAGDGCMRAAIALIPAGGSSDTPLAVDNGSGVGEGQNVSLLFDEAYVIPVTNGSMVAEGQEIPFILTQPGTEGSAVGEGQEIMLSALAFIVVDHGEGVGEGQEIILDESFILPLIAGSAVGSGQSMNLAATGQAVLSGPTTMSRRRGRR